MQEEIPLTINCQMRVTLAALGRDALSSGESPSYLLLCRQRTRGRAGSRLCPEGREGGPVGQRQGQVEGARAGLPAATDVQTPRFKRKLNVITWLIKY